jgi:polar amino acid transport system permease protein
MDFNFIAKYAPEYLEAAKLTLTLSFYGIVLSLVIGFLFSLIRYYKIPILRRIVEIYIEISRNTPLLIQLFFLYYGLPKMGVLLEAKTCAIVGLSFLGGSYMAESFRSGLEAVGKIQIESGLSIGLTKLQLIRYVILPQALAISVPSLGANAIFLLKETSLFSAVALADLMFVAKDLIGMYYKTNEALFMLVISYCIILLPFSFLLSFLERRLRYAGYGH